MRLFYFCALALFALSAFAANARAVTIAWSPVGNPGNLADTTIMTDGTTGYGSVSYAYNIGTYDVTNAQYAEFLNAKDLTGANTFGLYNGNMANASTFGGISFNPIGAPGGKYMPIAGNENYPVNLVNWYDAIRFANWLNNGQGNGDTETGAYTLGPVSFGGVPFNGNSITRNAGATVFLPNENEWYKAAYYDPTTGSYFKYATGSNTQPVGTAPPGGLNSANYFGSHVDHPTDAGAYTSSRSPYGTFDQSGNVLQWNEAFIDGAFRGLRGGAFDISPGAVASRFRSDGNPAGVNVDFGFRVAMIVPEPSSFVMASFALLGLLAWSWRRRRQR